MDSISVELDKEEIEVLLNFVCEEIELPLPCISYNKLNWLKVKLALKKNALEGD